MEAVDSPSVSVNAAEIAGQLKQSALFKPVSESDLQALVGAMTPQAIETGTTLFNKGDQGDAMYIILSGKVHIFTLNANGDPITLAHYGPGHVFGDFTLLDEQPRSASAVTEEACDLLVLTRAQFQEFLPQHPAIGLAMIRHLTDRLRYITIYLNKVTAFGQKLVDGNYDAALAELAASEGNVSEIDGLIAAFMHMIHKVKDREAQLAADQSVAGESGT